MPLTFELAGKTYPTVTHVVEADAIAAYAAASGDDNPVHQPGPDQVASPIFPVVPGLPLVGSVSLDPELGVDNPLMIVHGEEEIVHHRPTRPGDTLVLTPTLLSMDDKGTAGTFVVGISAATPDGEPVNDQYATIFVRDGGSGGPRPSPAAKPEEEEEPSVEVGRFTSHVAADMPSRYAEASGDFNPIHLDAGVAQAVGLPGVINHGLGTLSLVTAGLVRELADGDPVRLVRIQARFTDLVIPGSDLATTVIEASDRFRFSTARDDGSVVLTGEVEVR